MSAETAVKRAISIGTFDGIHLGHRALLERTAQLARAQSIRSLAYTFELPPQNYLGRRKSLLMPSEQKLQLLRNHVDEVEVSDFPKIQPLTPEEFVTQILVGELNAKFVVIGEDFCFGKNRQGNVTTLSQLSSIYDFEVEVVPPVQVGDHVVSSTAIREALREGDVKHATALLGKPHRIWGKVVPGAGEGRKLGYPTANLKIDPHVIVPRNGIYASLGLIGGEYRPCALYIGHRPTTQIADDVSVELHVLDGFNLDLYGSELEVQLVEFIRGDREFDSVDELKSAIAQDIADIRMALHTGFENAG